MSEDVVSSNVYLTWLLPDYFNNREAWGDWRKMNPLLLWLLDSFRGTLPNGCWIKVHCGYKEGGHTKNSFHYRGMAIDFHVVGCSFLEAEAHLTRFLNKPRTIDGEEFRLIDFVGIGIYPEWNSPGFHLDIRGKRASWSRLSGKYVAYELGLDAAKQVQNGTALV